MNITERIEQQAAQWLERREQPDWSDDDRATLDAWLDASIAHKLAYWRLEHGWTKVGRLAALRQVPPPRSSTAAPSIAAMEAGCGRRVPRRCFGAQRRPAWQLGQPGQAAFLNTRGWPPTPAARRRMDRKGG